jgi:hypothetical protein
MESVSYFLGLSCNATIVQRLFTRCKNREEIELQEKQSIPEVQKNMRKWKYSTNEIIRIKKLDNQRIREEALRNSAPDIQ